MVRLASASITTLEAVTKKFSGFTLGPVSCRIDDGVTALLGANGAGKSTLMRLIVGTERPGSGKITIAGSAGDIGFLPQDFSGPPYARVGDYLAYVAWCRSSPRRRLTDSHIAEALERVNLSDRTSSKIGALSGGMVRRLGLAQAVLGGASLLVLDEPTVGLDPVQRIEVRSLIAELSAECSVIMSTHLSEDVSAVASRVLILDGGMLRFDGSLREMCSSESVTSERVEASFLRVVQEAAGSSGHE